MKTNVKCDTFLVVLGAGLLILPNGVQWYWGNLSVLTSSYVISRLHSTSGIDTPWVISLYIVFRSLGLIVYDFSRRLCGEVVIIFIGIMISDVSLFYCYFAINHSLMLLNIFIGIIQGFACGLLYGSALKMVFKISSRNVGFLTTFVKGSLATGAIFINEFVTLYANPNNLTPDIPNGGTTFFSQIDIIDKVPSLFLYIGCFSLVSHITAVVVLKLTGVMHTVKQTDSTEKIALKGAGDQGDGQTTEESANGKLSGSPAKEDGRPDFTPRQMLKTTIFYVLWWAFFVADFPHIMQSNYYKILGQQWIHDDHFLTYIGVVLVFLNSWIRCIWGILLDTCKLKNYLVYNLSGFIVINIWFYFTPMYSKWIYLVSNTLLACMAGSLFSTFPVILMNIYGKGHFTTNLGLLSSAPLIFNIIGPGLMTLIRTRLGWFATYGIPATFNILSLTLSIIFIP